MRRFVHVLEGFASDRLLNCCRVQGCTHLCRARVRKADVHTACALRRAQQELCSRASHCSASGWCVQLHGCAAPVRLPPLASSNLGSPARWNVVDTLFLAAAMAFELQEFELQRYTAHTEQAPMSSTPIRILSSDQAARLASSTNASNSTCENLLNECKLRIDAAGEDLHSTSR